MDSSKLSSEKIEVASIGRAKDGSVYHHTWQPAEIDTLLERLELAKPKDTETTEQALGNAGTAELRGET